MHSGPDRERNGSDLLFLVVLLSVFTALATYISFRKSIWLDETFTLERTGTSLELTLKLARYRSLKPPLYFVAVYYWRHFGDTIEFVRGLSTLSVALALVYLHQISRALGIGGGWRSLAIIGALTPHIIWAAIEARAYGLTILCLTAATYYFIRLWVTGSEHRWRDNILFVLFGYAGILSFYYAGFIVAGLFLAGLFGKDHRRLVWSGVALALLLSPWIHQLAEHVGQQGNPLPPLDLEGSATVHQARALIAWLFGLPSEIIFRHVTILSRPGVESGVMVLGLALLGLRVGLGQPRWSHPETMLWIATGAGIGLLAGIRITNVQMMDLRHWSIAAPALIVLPSYLASRLRPAWAARGAALTLVGLFGLTTLSYARNEVGRHDYHAAAELVMREERPGEPIVHFIGNPASFQYYYHGPNAIRRLPWNRGDQVLPPAARLHFLNHLASGDQSLRSFWVVQDVRSPAVAEVLEATFDAPVTILGRWEYYEVWITHLRLGDLTGEQPR